MTPPPDPTTHHTADAAQTEALSRAAWVLRERLDDMKRHRSQYSEAQLRAVAKEYIQAVYAWQVAKYGRVVKPLGVAGLLR